MNSGHNDAAISCIGGLCEEQPHKRPLLGYTCHRCTYVNKATALACELCSAERVELTGSTSWSCGACTAENESSAGKCVVCGCERDGIDALREWQSEQINAVSVTEGSGPEFVIWSCGVCSYENVAQGEGKAACELCGAARSEEFANGSADGNAKSGESKRQESEAEAGAAVFDSATSTSGIIELLRTKIAATGTSGDAVAAGTKKRQRPATEAFLCSPLLHISQRGFEGAHWSCGYRNIQMLCSSLIQRPEYRAVLFNGSNDIPDVCGIQAWIEKAWQAGFDTMGCLQLGGTLLGTRKWIGATECACLLRFMGVRAMVVDFSHSPPDHTGPGGQQSSASSGSSSSASSSSSSSSSSSGWPIHDSTSKKRKQPEQQPKHEMIVEWCKRYFSSAWGTPMDYLGGDPPARAMDDYLPPLYFQHNGHSRTIVGYETASDKPSLFVFDPSHRGDTIKRYLNDGLGWQRMLKRGLHTLRKNQYQIVYIKPGIMSAQEREQSKVIGAEF